MRGRPLMFVVVLAAAAAGCSSNPTIPEVREVDTVGGPAYEAGHTFGSGNGAPPADGGETTASDTTITGGGERGSGGFGSGH
jgi:hypothetical protein